MSLVHPGFGLRAIFWPLILWLPWDRWSSHAVYLAAPLALFVNIEEEPGKQFHCQISRKAVMG